MPPVRPLSRHTPDSHISSDGAETPGIDRNSAPLASVKMVLLTPIPRASVAMAVAAKIGLRVSERRAYLKSCNMRLLSAKWGQGINVRRTDRHGGEPGRLQKSTDPLTCGLQHGPRRSEPPARYVRSPQLFDVVLFT